MKKRKEKKREKIKKLASVKKAVVFLAAWVGEDDYSNGLKLPGSKYPARLEEDIR